MLLSIAGAVALIALDQITKYLATVYLAPVGTMPFLPGVMQLMYVLNDGAAFSLLAGNRIFLIAVTSLALLALLWYLFCSKKVTNRWERLALVLILSGGIGNLIDRILHGYVVDFFAVTFMDFAVFNVADCYVTVGVILLILVVIRGEVRTYKAKNAAGHHDGTGA